VSITSTFQFFFMSKILAVKPITTKAGRPMVIVSTIERDHFVTRAQWDAHKYSPVFDAYVGGTFSADYFSKGDTLLSGDIVTDDGVILREFSAAQNPTVIAAIAGMLLVQENTAAQEMSALFARKRAAETPEQATARREAAAAARAARVVPASPIEA